MNGMAWIVDSYLSAFVCVCVCVCCWYAFVPIHRAERQSSQFNAMKARLDKRNDHVRDRKQIIVAKKLKKNKKVRKE